MKLSQEKRKMNELKLIEAVKKSDMDALQKLISENDAAENINQQDEHGWTALHWAAGAGETKALQLLIDNGADPTLAGNDERTPLMIAKAASRHEAVKILTETEKKRGQWVDPADSQAYCKAYYVRDLRRYPYWAEGASAASNVKNGEAKSSLGDNDIVYLHHDFTVTRSMWKDQDVIFSNTSAEWQGYCRNTLQFAVPGDIL
jgi:hypothetical protein